MFLRNKNMIIIDYIHIEKKNSLGSKCDFCLPFLLKMIHACMLWLLSETLQVTCGIV